MTSPALGVAAGLATAGCWAGCVQFFGAASRRIGANTVNMLRLVGAVVLLALAHVVIRGTLLPSDMSSRAFLLFTLSGVVGLAFGDTFLFHALARVGPVLASLVMTTGPAIAAILAHFTLGERLSPSAIGGMFVTVVGIGLAVSAGRDRAKGLVPVEGSGRALALGLLLAFGGAVGQAAGVVVAKPALAEHSALSGTLVRMVAATFAMGLLMLAGRAVVGRDSLPVGRFLRDRRALWLTLAGTIVGPFLGVWLSLVATKHVEVGIAATLMAIVPILVMIQDWVLGRHRLRPLEGVGAILGVAGVALLVNAAKGS